MDFLGQQKCSEGNLKPCTLLFSEGSNMMATEETNFDRGYIKKKLEHGLTRIWQVWFFKLLFKKAIETFMSKLF